jgi:PAS domain S-box-containing protein
MRTASTTEHMNPADQVSGGQRVIRDLEQALDSLRDSEELFRQLAENSREVFWMIDRATGKLLYLGEGFDRMWGIPRAEIFERMDAFLRLVHPDDVQRLTERMRNVHQVMAMDNEKQVEYRILRPDGELRWIRIRAFPIRDGNGAIYRLGGLMEDVTQQKVTEAALMQAQADLERRVAERTAALSELNERLTLEAAERMRAERLLRQSEERLRRQLAELDYIYRTAPVGLAFFDAELRFVRINERLAAINGLPVERHLGRSLREVLPEISRVVEPLLRRVVESGEAVLDHEVRGATPAEPDVERVWMASYYPFAAVDGRILGVGAIVHDLSQRTWAEQRARRHLEDLAHVSRLSTMGEMAAGIAHELNQPLAAMANFAFVGLHSIDADENPDGPALRALFNELLEQSLRAGEIVQHLRAFIKKSNPQRQLVAVGDLIRDVLTLVEPEMRLHGVPLEVHLADAPLIVRADTIQVQQVILNLLRNALEAMAEGPVETRRLTITASSVDGVAEIAVADSGPGLPESAASRVFDAFFTTKPTGMGMGLAISRSIIEDHDGRLWADNRSLGGATFRFTLPIAGKIA